jgi:GntR family transcriptional repressor for pyruvate dehydrogenase complex
MPDVFDAIPRPQAAGQAVEHHVKELIRARRLVSGDRLPAERDLADRLGVSRSTLRGALQSLAEQGVLSGRQGSGWTITPDGSAVAANMAVYLSLEDVAFADLFTARRAIEPEIAAAAAMRRTDEQLIALSASVDAMRAAASAAAYLQADSDFHALLASASHNVVFRLMLAPILELLQGVRLQLSGEPVVTNVSHREHDAILAAVRAQQADVAAEAMRDHIDQFVVRARGTTEHG